MNYLIRIILLACFVYLMISLASCIDQTVVGNDVCNDITINTGKIKALKINEGRNYKVFNYRFNYDEATGKIERISNDSVNVCTFIEIKRDSFIIEWRTRSSNNVYQIWSVRLDDNNKPLQIHNIDPNSGFILPYLRIAYKNDGSIDTIYEPNVLSLSSKDHSFVFSDENCQNYVYQYAGDFQNGSDEIAMTYTSYLNNFQIPRQRPYNAFKTIFETEAYLDPLYLLGLWGVEVLPLNRNLIHMKDDMRYSYEFDICNRVKYMVITTEGVEDTLVTMRMTYY